MFFFLLKLVLMVLLNETYAYATQDTQTILLPAWKPTAANNISLPLKVFGYLIQLNLRRTRQIVTPTFDIWKDTIGVIKKWTQSKASKSCFYVHESRVSYAIIDFCQENGLVGLVFLKNDMLEIKPFRNNFIVRLPLIDDFCVGEQINLSFGQLHLIQRSRHYFHNLNFHYLDNFKSKQRHIRSTQKKLTIEMAVFFDSAAYDNFMSFLDNSEEQLRNMILAYVNNIQALFHHASFGVPLDILLVRLDIMKKQPQHLPLVDSITEMFLSFCNYAAILNPPDDNDPNHWDIGLYITGTNLFEIKTQMYYSGLNYENGACNTAISCAMVQFGFGRMTSGFASSLFATSLIGHVLGISNDNGTIDSRCPIDTHIMSNQRYYKNQITWSECSRDVAKELCRTKTCLLDHTNQENRKDALDHSRYHDSPGTEWTAKAQCELFLRDKDANVVTLHDICQILQCETPKKDGYFFAGPALDGTHCALGKKCRGGECVPISELPYFFKYCKKDEWSEWKEDDCQSRCLTKSKGVIIKRRSCKHRTFNTTKCEGPYYAVDLCDDSNICNNRKTIEEFSNTKCTEFSWILEENHKNLYNIQKLGWRASYDFEKPSRACTIFCLREHVPYISSPYISPYAELLNIGVNPYFPDGTWCHNENGQDYYCRQHYCLPENYTIEE